MSNYLKNTDSNKESIKLRIDTNQRSKDNRIANNQSATTDQAISSHHSPMHAITEKNAEIYRN